MVGVPHDPGGLRTTGPSPTRDLEELIRLRDLRGLRQAVAGWTPSEIADLIDRLPAREGGVLFRLLPRHLLAEVFEFLDSGRQKRVVEDLAKEADLLTELLGDLSADDRTALLEELPGEAAQRLLTLLPPEERRIAITLLGYPEGSVGRLMAPDYVAVRPGWTVEEALAHVRQYGKDSETFDVLYVVD
ncbi:MAG TPA: magnesium transporter, partial [Methylomirabilota bacterium]|nr:magnesium transporter [Methylomirabilota bacterium]